MKRNCWFPNTLGRDDSNKPKVGMDSAPETKGHEPRRTSVKSQQADSLRREQNQGLFALETAAAAAAAKSLQSCPTLCDPIDGSHQVLRLWDSPGKNTGVGCHYLLQCMKVKSESEVAQSCPTPSNPMDCSHQAPPSLGFSRQEYWSGVSLPSPVHALETEMYSKSEK